MTFLQKTPLTKFFRLLIVNNLNLVLLEWVYSIADLSKGQIIAIDGKTIRGTKAYRKKSPIHRVSTWTCENNLVLEAG